MAGNHRAKLTSRLVGVLVLIAITACGSSLAEETPRDAAVWLGDSPSSWTRVEDPTLGGVGEQQMTSVTAFEERVVAGGFETFEGDADARVWISPDGSTWEKISDSGFGGSGEQMIWAIAAAGEGLIAGGTTGRLEETDAALWYSPDGRDWLRAPMLPSWQGPGNQAVLAVASYEGRIFAAGRDYLDAGVWVSEDGISWSQVTDPVFGGEGEQVIYDLEVAPQGLIAVGDDALDAAVWILDEAGWRQLDDTSFGGDGHQMIQDIISLDTGFVAVGGVFEYDEIYFLGRGLRGHLDAVAWVSRDGVDWIRIEDDAVLGGRGHQVLERVVEWDSTLVGVGYDLAGRGNVIEGLAERGSGLDVDAAVWVSDNGTEWEYMIDGDLGGEDWQDIWDIVIVPEIGAVAVGGDDFGTSTDDN